MTTAKVCANLKKEYHSYYGDVMYEKCSSTAKTVEKALLLIECFLSAPRELGISEIARLAGINKSTVQRIVNTLSKYGYLQQTPHNSGYRLGFKFLHVSGLLLERIDLRPIARPSLEELRDKTGETVHLMILDNDMGVYLDAVESRQSTRVVSAVGSRDELHTSAVGKALLAFLPEQQVDGILRRKKLKAKTPQSITDPEVFKGHLKLIQRRGYAIDDEEGEKGTRCVGAPIFDHDHHVVASISVAAPTQRLGLRNVPQVAASVIETALRISQCLGRGTPQVKEGGFHARNNDGIIRPSEKTLHGPH
ncbi:MAG: IclR family transcriptional regulator [Candidatus Methylomirabilota bacterium]